MAAIIKLALKFAAVGAVIPVVFALVSLAVPLFPVWLLMTVLVLCPPYIFFLATAACGPFDACSLNMLALVMACNAVIYGLLGCGVYAVSSYLRLRSGRSAKGGAA
jgi:hypothetical protein